MPACKWILLLLGPTRRYNFEEEDRGRCHLSERRPLSLQWSESHGRKWQEPTGSLRRRFPFQMHEGGYRQGWWDWGFLEVVVGVLPTALSPEIKESLGRRMDGCAAGPFLG